VEEVVVVVPAEAEEVVEVGGSAVDPVHEVVDVADLAVAAFEAAGDVAFEDLFAQEPGDVAAGAADVAELAELAEHGVLELGVAGEAVDDVEADGHLVQEPVAGLVAYWSVGRNPLIQVPPASGSGRRFRRLRSSASLESLGVRARISRAWAATMAAVHPCSSEARNASLSAVAKRTAGTIWSQESRPSENAAEIAGRSWSLAAVRVMVRAAVISMVPASTSQGPHARFGLQGAAQGLGALIRGPVREAVRAHTGDQRRVLHLRDLGDGQGQT
jgi:hypothetical protein